MTFYDDIFWICIVFVIFIFAAFFLRKNAEKHPSFKVISAVLAFTAVYLVAWAYILWGTNILSINSKIDGRLMFIGTAATGTPYVDNQSVDAPTYYAFCRFVVYVLGDGEFADYRLLLDRMNCFGLLSMVVCTIIAVGVHIKRYGRPSALSVAAFLSVCCAAIIPVTRNIEVGNTGLWPAGFIAIYLLCLYVSKSRWVDFVGGMALGMGFMLKPNLILVLVFLCVFALRGRVVYGMAGIIVSGVLGFLGSLMVPGIDLDTYSDFVTKVPNLLVVGHYQRTHYNLSLLQYVPQALKRVLTPLAILGFGAVAFFTSKKAEREDILPWFFVTVLPFPIVWGMHFMAWFPAFLFFLFYKKESEQVVVAAAAVLLVFFGLISEAPLVVNALLISLWLWQLYLMFLREEIGLRDGDKRS
jgi:hypothetical protein